LATELIIKTTKTDIIFHIIHQYIWRFSYFNIYPTYLFFFKYRFTHASV